MCSRNAAVGPPPPGVASATGAATGPAQQAVTPPSSQSAPAPTGLLSQLAGALDGLLAADLSQLSSDEHSQLVTGLVRAQSSLHAATMDAVAAFDSADVASTSRHRSTKQWLAHRTRLSLASASSLVSTARVLRDVLPATRDVLAAGRVSPAHVAAIASVVRTVGVEYATTAEPILLELSSRADPSAVKQATAAIFAEVDPDGAEAALDAAYEKRGVTLSVVQNHGYLNGVLDLESTELLQSVLMPLMGKAGDGDRRSAPQRRADALLDVAKKHADTADMPTLGGHRPHLSVVIDSDQLPPLSEGSSEGQPGGQPGGASGEAGGESRGWRGTVALPWTRSAIPASSARRWACHAVLTPVVAKLLGRRRGVDTPQPGVVVVEPAWLPLAVGRGQRTATAAQLKALVVRDGGCIHPGCSRTPAYCDAHHVVHWADGGSTDVSNMVLLCRHHHRTLHMGTWRIVPDPGTPGLFWTTDPEGLHQAQTSTDRSPPPRHRAA